MAKGREKSKTIRSVTFKCGDQKLSRRYHQSTSSGDDARVEDENKDDRPLSSSSSSSATRWNLRSSSSAAAVADGGSGKCDDHSLVQRAENGDGVKLPAKSRVSSEKPGTIKITVSLSKREIEEDYMLLFGREAPRRPKNKRPNKVQKTLDTLYPGLCLNNVSLNSYKVSKSRENSKR